MRIWDRRMCQKLEVEIPLAPAGEDGTPVLLTGEETADAPPPSENGIRDEGFDLYQFYGGGIDPPADSPAEPLPGGEPDPPAPPDEEEHPE